MTFFIEQRMWSFIHNIILVVKKRPWKSTEKHVQIDAHALQGLFIIHWAYLPTRIDIGRYTYLQVLFGWKSKDMTSLDSTLGVIATLTIGASARCAFLNAWRIQPVRALRMCSSTPTHAVVLRKGIDGNTLLLKTTEISTITITTMVLKVCWAVANLKWCVHYMIIYLI